MSWHSIEVDGQVLYESSNGERVADPAAIERLNATARRPLTLDVYPERSDFGIFVLGVSIGAILGFVAGALLS